MLGMSIGSHLGAQGAAVGRWSCGLLGEAEVEDLGVAARGDENVGGLDIAVDDTLACAASSASAI
jgi:hypothetical protein